MFAKWLFVIILFPVLVCGAEQACDSKKANVILLTLDGVRSHEFFKGTSSFYFNRRKIAKDERGIIFKKFWQEHVQKGVLYGNNGVTGRYKINSDVAISLPSYQGMMIGKDTICRNNGCERIAEESLPERLKKELHLTNNELAVFTSWQDISRAVESKTGSITSSFGLEGFDDGTSDPIFAALSKDAMTDLPPWGDLKKTDIQLRWPSII